jgi:hypothetical protein
MNSAIARSWSEFDRAGSGGASAAAAAAAGLPAVEESVFIIGSSSVRALQTRCAMVAVVFMSRYIHRQ